MEFENIFYEILKENKVLINYLRCSGTLKIFEKRTIKGFCINPGCKISKLCDFIIKYEVRIYLNFKLNRFIIISNTTILNINYLKRDLIMVLLLKQN